MVGYSTVVQNLLCLETVQSVSELYLILKTLCFILSFSIILVLNLCSSFYLYCFMFDKFPLLPLSVFAVLAT